MFFDVTHQESCLLHESVSQKSFFGKTFFDAKCEHCIKKVTEDTSYFFKRRSNSIIWGRSASFISASLQRSIHICPHGYHRLFMDFLQLVLKYIIHSLYESLQRYILLVFWTFGFWHFSAAISGRYTSCFLGTKMMPRPKVTVTPFAIN